MLRAPIKHAVGDRQSLAIYQLRSSARSTLASTGSSGISVGRDLAWLWRRRPADAPPVEPGLAWSGPARHDDEAQLGGVTFDGRLPSIRHFRDGRNPDAGRLIRPAVVATVHFPRSSIR